MQWLDQRLRGGRRTTATQVAEEFEISTRTVYRDIAYMRLMLGAPIKYDRARRGYYYTDDAFTLAAVRLTEGELLALFLAERVLQQYAGAPYGQQLRGAFEKICHSLTDTVTVDLAGYGQSLSFNIGPVREPDVAVFPIVSDALCRRVALQIRYHTQTRDCDTERVVEPYHLHNRKGDWYLIAYCRSRREVRNFLLSRIREAKATKEGFEVPEDFDTQAYIAESFGIEKGGEPSDVSVWFDSYEARWIRECQWHSTQTIDEHDDGSLTIHFRAVGLDEISRWVLSYGEHAVVLEPKALRGRVTRALSLALDAYEKKKPENPRL